MKMRSLIVAFACAAVGSLSSTAFAQQLYSGPTFGMCPDAPPEEAGIFKKVKVPEPRIDQRGDFAVEGSDANLQGHKVQTFELIPKAWQQLNQAIPQMQDAVRPATPMADGTKAPPATYALCWGGDPASFHFMPGVEVSEVRTLMSGFSGVVVPANRYAVFTYSGPVTGTGDFRWSVGEYMKASTLKRKNDPNFEVYQPGDDPMASNISMEFWVPIERRGWIQ
jgi:predicted transcriptional regulator YdeE